MSWSFRIARVFDIDIKVHVSFFLILVLGAYQWGMPYGAPGALFGVLLMLLLFVCVTLHELGHSVVAQRFGIPVREIILLPLGGVALLGRNPATPLQELLIAAAGPLVNVLIAAVLLPLGGGTALLGTPGSGGILQEGPLTLSLPTLLAWLLGANVALVLFNLIPAFPLDGGRMLRALLGMVMSHSRATRIAAFVGQTIALGLGFFGVMSGNLLLVLVAAFIFFGAGQERAESQAHTVLNTLRVGDAYNKHALRLEIGDRVSKVVDYILTSYQPDFAVMQGSNLLGVVTRADVLNALSSGTSDGYVTGIMRREVVRVSAGASLDEVRQTMAENNTRIVAVYEGNSYLGLVSLEDIAEAFTVVTFLQRQREARRAEQAGAG